MKIKALRKTAFTAVVTLSTASVYFAQSVKDSARSKDIETVVLTGVADIAKDRKTPVAVSTIREAQIVEKLGNQEFPEILNTTPSIYATKSGGGFGDATIRVRGFDQVNTAILINGVPVNDMENGKVYWSNWAGLSDVTSAMQVQRGLGSSKLAIASVGGTINILTRAADRKKEGTVTASVGNDQYHKLLFAYNTGKYGNGWSSSFLMSRTAGNMYFNGSEFEGYNYYFALGYNPSPKHDLQFTITGAPQWHHQRYETSIKDFLFYGEDGKPNRKYNPNWGYLDGQEFSMIRNYYYKPVISLNWDYKISPSTKLSSVFYASNGRGAGTGDAGRINGKNIYSLARTAEGLIDFDNVVDWNRGATVPQFGANNSAPFTGGVVRRASVNSHNWLGAIVSLNHKLNDYLSLNLGLDGRSYRGYHYRVVSNFLGNTSYKDTSNINNTPNIVTNSYDAVPTWNPLGGKNHDVKDQITYSNDGIVKWLGGFGQLEYSKDNLSAFIQGSVSNQNFQRVDYFLYKEDKQKSEKKSLVGYNVKGGVNYNLNSQHNVFANAGYYERQPFFNAIYPSLNNDVNAGVTNEKVLSFEAGYGFRSRYFTANLNAYLTTWGDIFRRISYKDASNATYYANLQGLTQKHQGIELDFTAKPSSIVSFNGMVSVGKFEFKGNPSATIVDDENKVVNNTTLYLDGLKVGDVAQLTAALGADIKFAKWAKLDATYRYADNLYSRFEPTSRVTPDANMALKLPSFGLVDLGLSFNHELSSGEKFILRFNVNNLLDKVYISESATNIPESTNPANNWNGINVDNRVNFGFGRTWNTSVTFKF
ncbi:TonB-dependent receptor [Riemerella anatipestifer]|uniref:TonB-dependent receptor n=1 Tax=Riemerella anatipestifer TaxID=34085 RepID=UPI00129DEE65|nr:TonB-dependent receptor [Riemerella anatipestifer]MRM82685.1 TonB-dependent receptor [Riemerella anatipestifer]